MSPSTLVLIIAAVLAVAFWLLAISEQDTDGPDDMPGWD